MEIINLKIYNKYIYILFKKDKDITDHEFIDIILKELDTKLIVDQDINYNYIANGLYLLKIYIGIDIVLERTLAYIENFIYIETDESYLISNIDSPNDFNRISINDKIYYKANTDKDKEIYINPDNLKIYEISINQNNSRVYAIKKL